MKSAFFIFSNVEGISPVSRLKLRSLHSKQTEVQSHGNIDNIRGQCMNMTYSVLSFFSCPIYFGIGPFKLHFLNILHWRLNKKYLYYVENTNVVLFF